jgi:uncharacterized protein YfaS (alpha-2-macroglobulin family)
LLGQTYSDLEIIVMRLIGFVVLSILLLASSEFAFGSSFSLTVETDKQCYRRWEYVNISGNLTYNDWGVQGCSVALAVKNPSNNTIIMETAVTGEFCEYNFSFRLSNQTELGTYTVYANYQEASNRTTFRVYELIGDVNGDGKVDLKDIYKVAYAYGSDPRAS